MKFTVDSTPVTLQELIDNAGYFISDFDVSDEVLVQIQPITAGTTLYIEGSGVKVGSNYIINSTESRSIATNDILEFAIRGMRLKTVRLIACCDPCDVLVNIL